MLHASGLGDGVSSQPKVPDELKDKTTSTNKGTGTIPGVPDVPKDQSKSENKSWEIVEMIMIVMMIIAMMMMVMILKLMLIMKKLMINRQNLMMKSKKHKMMRVNEEEYEEIYGDVNISLKNGNQVKDDVQETQKTEGLIPSSSIFSDYAAKYLNFDNIPPVDIEVVSMLDINVQHEVPCTSPLLTIPYLGTSLDDALHKVLQKYSADITKEHYVPAEIVKRLRQQYVPEKGTKDIRKIKMDHARQVLDKFRRKQDDADKDEGPSAGSDRGLRSFQENSSKLVLLGFAKEEDKFETAFRLLPDAMYIIMVCMAMDTDIELTVVLVVLDSAKKSGVADEFRMLLLFIVTTAWYRLLLLVILHLNAELVLLVMDGTTWYSLLLLISKIAKAEKPSLSFDELMSTPIDFSGYLMNNLKIDNLTHDLLVRPAFNFLKGTCKSRVELEYNFEECYKVVNDRLDWNNPEVVPADFFFNNDLEYLKGGSSSKKYTTSTTKTKAAKYDIPGIKDMVNVMESAGGRPSTRSRKLPEEAKYHQATDISNKTPYTAYSNPQGIIYNVSSDIRFKPEDGFTAKEKMELI
ncbi:hypothetical protein Tco_0085781 [Tanacetum coccineum]